MWCEVTDQIIACNGVRFVLRIPQLKISLKTMLAKQCTPTTTPAQFAPYNSHYEQLPQHMAAAGVQPLVNHWNEPLALLHDAATTHVEQHKSPDGKSTELRSKPTPAYSILPPEKLTPFVIPFKGGPGALCGGPATTPALSRCVGMHCA